MACPSKVSQDGPSEPPVEPTVLCEYTSHNVLVDLDTEYEGDLLSDAPAAEARVPPFHLNDRSDQRWGPATLLRFHRALVRRKYQWLFSPSTRRRPGPKGPSRLFRFHRWRANLRVLDIEELKSVPFAPRSHPFIERLIGTLRREYLDQTFFWNGLDLHRKLDRFALYYSHRRVHAGLNGRTPVEQCGTTADQPANLNHLAWRSDCSDLFHTPTAA